VKSHWIWGLLIIIGLLLLGTGLLLTTTRNGPSGTGQQFADRTSPVPGDPAPPAHLTPQATAGPRTGGQPWRTGSPRRLSERAEDMTAEERAEFEKKFTTKLKPAVERWCKLYAGHTPFRPDDLTPDKLRTVVSPDSARSYAFVVNGTTLCVDDDPGDACVSYLMAPAARQLDQLPKEPAPPVPVSITRQEIMRLLKADSGRDFPPNEVAITPTAWSGAMNGGVYVDAGKNVRSYSSPEDYSMVFGPDGNLACYQRGITPRRPAGRQR
jgi:hypothetical protein